MGTVTFNTYKEAFDFFFAARELGFEVNLKGNRVKVSGVPRDDQRWEALTDLLGPYRKLTER